MKRLLPLISLLFLLSSCQAGIQKEGKNIKSMYFDNVPTSAIKIGEFNNAGITLNVTYSDNKTQAYPVTEDWLPEEELHYSGEPGTYEVKILFRGKTVRLSFAMESNENAPKYNVTFFDYQGKIVEKYMISHRLDAVYHGKTLEREGYVFAGWDNSLYGVSHDMSYHPVYVAEGVYL